MVEWVKFVRRKNDLKAAAQALVSLRGVQIETFSSMSQARICT